MHVLWQDINMSEIKHVYTHSVELRETRTSVMIMSEIKHIRADAVLSIGYKIISGEN
jgi:hypothetical protein